MKRRSRFGILLGLLAGSLPASAAEQGIDFERARIAREDCRFLTIHVPDPGVAYEAGRDVAGHPVAPADLPGAAALPALETFATDIIVITDERLDVLDNLDAFRPETRVGLLELREGRLFFDGVPLDDPERHALLGVCGRILGTGE